ncbi:MAG: hypothetical protein O2887_07940 [Bacteroidetes bacterium]|nr:hypothetical protein [Bacteroidota bacterium]MDA1120409.1 hypothetical protein [Bacteroidota bacterium]
MKSAILIFVLAATIFDINDIAKINALKAEADKSYLKGDYQSAFDKYTLLVDSFKVTDDNLLLNYANSSYFLTGLNGKIGEQAPQENSTYAEVAMSNYQKLTSSKDTNVKSAAYNQLGVINYHMGLGIPKGEKFINESLAYFKQSLKSSPQNDNARYNYELVKKQLEEQKNQQDQEQNEDKENEENKEDQEQQDKENQDQENKDQENQDQQNQENEQEQEQRQNEQQDKEGEQKEDQEPQSQEQDSENQEDKGEQEQQQQSTQDKLEEMNISEDMAKMILEALRNNEVQYIQQQKRKPTKKQDSTKPDW